MNRQHEILLYYQEAFSAINRLECVGLVRIVNGCVLTGECFDELIHPEMPVPAQFIVFHGITDEMLVGKPDIKKILPRFVEFIGDAVLVARNAPYDMKFIKLQSEM